MAITKTTSSYNHQTRQSEKETVTFAEGCVLRVWTRDVQVMSDVWEPSLHAQYWNEETQKVETDLWLDNAQVDATEEVKRKALAYINSQEAERLERCQARAYNELMEDAKEIQKGQMVKVVSGRTAKGTVGKVAVVIKRNYGMGYHASLEDKLAVATSDEKVKVAAANGKVYENYKDVVWVWARNCEQVEVPAVDMEEVKDRAKQYARSERYSQWGDLLRKMGGA